MPGLFPGTMVTPAVRLVRPLRSGGMGSVWVAEHLGLHTEVAVKFLSSDLASDPESVGRFSREAAAASQVKSPHVVQMFDHGVDDHGVPFIVMELLEGEVLTHRLADGALSPYEVARIVGQIGKALSRAHEKGIIHRDIKPDNIFLCDEGQDEVFCKLLDFGIAKGGWMGTLSGKTATGSLLGTPHYMSPEQAVSAKEIDHRTDVWSLGMVAFEGLTGRRAFDADSIGALVLAIHTSDLPVPTEVNPSLPARVDPWFAKACARDPDERYQSAKDLSDALSRAIGESLRPPPKLRPSSTAKQNARRVPGQTSQSDQWLSDQLVGRDAEPSAETLDAPRLSPPPVYASASARAITTRSGKGAPPQPAASVPAEIPSKNVPSLRPPKNVEKNGKRKDGDADWGEFVDRTNQVPIGVGGAPLSPHRPALGDLAAPRQRSSNAPMVMLFIALGVLVGLGVMLLAGGTDALAVLFPGFAHPSSTAPPPPPPR